MSKLDDDTEFKRLKPSALSHAPNYTIHRGDVLDMLPTLPSDYFSGSLSDPPYEISMMNKEWDSTGIAFNPDFWCEMYRVLKPGSYLLAFGGTRTSHRLTCAIEDAGFEIRDCLMWMYGTGFPKSRATLKPGYEPIVLARKPASRGLALNIEECRISPGELVAGGGGNFGEWRRAEGRVWCAGKVSPSHTEGRYPTNAILGESVAEALDAQTGNRRVSRGNAGSGESDVYSPKRNKNAGQAVGYGDTGGASRFFYCPKASRHERDAGLKSFPLTSSYMVENGSKPTTTLRNPHPCVKPLALNQWLASLIKPQKNGRLLVPFSGSGSEMIGGLRAGWDEVVGIELMPEYVTVAEARLKYHQK